jgi:hypothetical protein
VQAFMKKEMDTQHWTTWDPKKYHKWVLDEGDVDVKLNLQTDTQGYVNFTGVNVAQLGLETLASFVATQNKVSTLAAKLTAKRTRTVLVDFSVSPKPIMTDHHCEQFSVTKTALFHLYLEEWLDNYFEQINYDYQNKPIPNQLKIQSVELSTQIAFAVDISGGATPNILGNGSTFIVPINGLSLDYSPDYSHKIDLTLKLCDNSAPSDDDQKVKKDKKQQTENPCFTDPNNPEQSNLPPALLDRQCLIYAYIEPLLSGVKPPKDRPFNEKYRKSCNKKGFYELKPNQQPNQPMTHTGPKVMFF